MLFTVHTLEGEVEGGDGCYAVTATCGRVLLRRYWEVEGEWWVWGLAFDITVAGRKEQRVPR